MEDSSLYCTERPLKMGVLIPSLASDFQETKSYMGSQQEENQVGNSSLASQSSQSSSTESGEKGRTNSDFPCSLLVQ